MRHAPPNIVPATDGRQPPAAPARMPMADLLAALGITDLGEAPDPGRLAATIERIRIWRATRPDPAVEAAVCDAARQAWAAAGVADPDATWAGTAPPARNGRREGAAPVALVVRTMADIAPEPVEWLWDGRIPVGGITLLIGDPGEGKSMATLAIATAVTLGAPLPGETAGAREPGDVLLLAAEDSEKHTIRPRLDAMGADVLRVHRPDGILWPDGSVTPLCDLSDPVQRGALRDYIARTRPRLVIIDPLTAYLPGIDSHRDAEVRSVLAPLAEIAAEYRCAIVCVLHLRKSSADRAIYRASGSIAFVAAARSVLLAGRDPDDPRRRAIAHVKSNLSPLAPSVGYTIDGGRWGWTGESDLTADRILAAPAGAEERSALEEAIEWLAEYLADGPRAADEVHRDAARVGISARTLRRAREALQIRPTPDRDDHGRVRGWLWGFATRCPSHDGHLDGAGGWASGRRATPTTTYGIAPSPGGQAGGIGHLVASGGHLDGRGGPDPDDGWIVIDPLDAGEGDHDRA